MKLIVGLGNPGKEYEKTRHNAGFLCLEKYFLKNDIKPKLNKSFNALVAEVNDLGKKNIFLMPQTYMNLSGEAVEKTRSYYGIDVSDILVIYDDMDIEFGLLRIRESGSAGGHNGIKNIIMHEATLDIKRVRVGISSHLDKDAKDYVLGKFNKEELETMDKITNEVCEIIDEFIDGKSFQMIMQSHNGAISGWYYGF